MAQDTKTEVFYNVMPEITQSGKKPKTTPANSPAASAPQIQSKVGENVAPITIEQASKRWVIWVSIIIGVVVLAMVAGVVYWYLTGNTETQTENTVSIAEPEATQNPDVTTSPEWLTRYFGAEVCTEISICGDKSDPDRDGLDNISEFQKGTGPNDPDSDSDGIADGDEVNIFITDPLLTRTYREGTYTDPDFIKGGYDIKTNQVYTEERLQSIKAAIKEHGLHQPTLTTLGTLSFELYDFTDPNGPQLPADLDLSPQAKLDRDSQRQSTIKKIGSALLAYKDAKGSFPPVEDFVAMSDLIKPYNTLATNYNDPISIDPYNYGYKAENNNANFNLTYYSETQNQLIKYSDTNALADVEKDNSKADDDTRKADIENIAKALKVYSSIQLQPDSPVTNIFPPVESYKTELVPRYITSIPVDPVTKLDYQYEVGPTKETFTIKAVLKNPIAGTTGYLCNQETCQPY